MEKRLFGKTQLAVSILGYGAMELRRLEIAEAGQILNKVLDLGINYIDTSPDYGPSEEMIGKTLANRRSEYFLASKCGCNVDASGKGQSPAHVWSRQQLLWNIDNSLRLLKTDHLDVWQLHGTLPEELYGGATGEVIQTLQEIKKQGKVRWFGLSFKNGGPGDPLYPDGYTHAYITEFLKWNVFDLFQVVYGGLVRRNEIAINTAAAKGLGVVARGIVKQYQANIAERFTQANLQELCAHGESASQFLLRFGMNHPGISTMIIGTGSPAHLEENVKSVQVGKLPVDTYNEACRRLNSVGSIPLDL
jgi:aryl-alcohol dehydrogenase-like predicted oxidoreductase